MQAFRGPILYGDIELVGPLVFKGSEVACPGSQSNVIFDLGLGSFFFFFYESQGGS